MSIKPGTALIKISATTILTIDATNFGDEERIYSTEVEITVK